MGERQGSVRRARKQGRHALRGFIITWDVDSSDASTCSRLRRFVYGHELSNGTKSYRYPGLVEREGVRYLGQSVPFVTHARLPELQSFLVRHGIAHLATPASLG